MMRSQRWFLPGLFLITVSALLLEILDTRLLSVLTWYHLSFFAVSMAMFGLAAGAVHVYLGGARFEGEGARRSLAEFSLLFAFSIPVTHLILLRLPLGLDLVTFQVSSVIAAAFCA